MSTGPPPAYNNLSDYPPLKAKPNVYTPVPALTEDGWSSYQGSSDSRVERQQAARRPSPPLPRPTETTPLKSVNQHSPARSTLWRFFLFLLFSLTCIHFLQDRSNTDRPDVRDRIRKEWKQERVNAHEQLTSELHARELGFNTTLTNRLAVFEKAMLTRETQLNHTLSRRLDEFETEMTSARNRWEKEMTDIQAKLSEWREKDRERRESEERRIRTRLYWDDITAQPQCTRYNTREYIARLMNVPDGEDGLEWCRSTEIMIHGETYPKPNYCTIEYGKILGHFTVSTHEPSCKPYFESFKNKGCTAPGSRRRRFEGFLGNFQSEDRDNWREMCYSTPVDLWGQHFNSPEHCANWGRIGVWGIWSVEDDRC